MSNEHDVYERLHQLLDPALCGDQAEEASVELARLLRESESARLAYLDYVDDTVDLLWWGAQLNDSQPLLELPPTQPPDLEIQRFQFGDVAAKVLLTAACVGVLGFYLLFQNDRREDVAGARASRPNVATNPTVATLVRSIDATWRPEQHAPADFARLKIGNRIELSKGQVELLFDSGVELVARGPCRLEIKSENSIIAERGAIFARVGETGRGFALETPATKLVDFGTEFGVEIEEDGATDIAVFEGMVDIGKGEQDASRVERLFRGDAVRVSGEGHAVRLTAFDDVKFPVAGPATTGPVRPPVIAEVRDSISDRRVKKAYRIVRRGFWEDSPAFNDRQHEWNGVDERGLPEALLGGEYVMPFNDDKFFHDLLVEVDIMRPAKVFVLISDAVPLPNWLPETFEDTGWSVGLDEGPFEWRPDQTTEKGPGRSIETVFSVWELLVPAPTTLKLGGVTRHPMIHEGYNMYGIVAVPIEQAP